jgi:hypothetical protein
MSRNPKALPQLVYHGSPYRGIERFSTDKIGTGEGTWAFGYGLYFASRREIAEHYRLALSRRSKDRLMFDGALLDVDSIRGRSIEKVAILGRQGALQDLDDNIKFNEKYAPSIAELYKSVRDEIEVLPIDLVSINKGQLYEVEIPDDGEMLMWDKPLSDQPEAVKKTLSENTPLGGAKAPWALSGAQLYRSMARGAVGFPAIDSDQAASKYFASLGIKGIKYLDGDSRDLGEGSFNYVIFDGADTEITNVFYSRAPRERAR